MKERATRLISGTRVARSGERASVRSPTLETGATCGRYELTIALGIDVAEARKGLDLVALDAAHRVTF